MSQSPAATWVLLKHLCRSAPGPEEGSELPTAMPSWASVSPGKAAPLTARAGVWPAAGG